MWRDQIWITILLADGQALKEASSIVASNLDTTFLESGRFEYSAYE